MIPRHDPPKALQIGFLVLLVVCIAQVAWWITDQARLANGERDRLAALYEADARAVAAAFARATDRLAELMPHLELDPDAGTASVRAEAITQLAGDAASRINRYAWEGAFFLLVLLGGMTVLTRTIRHDANLRKRQQNFLAAVSHEFKSPLASMRLAAETLMLRTVNADSRRLGQRLLEDGDRLLRMVDNLLDIVRIEEGRLELQRESVALDAIIDRTWAEQDERARAHGIAAHRDLAEPLHVDADPAAIETVLRNLLDNAVKACIAGSGRNIWIRADRKGRLVTFAVADDGIGFPPREAVMIFEKFYRHGDEMRRASPGTGLGLAIVRRLALASGANVTATSDGPGRGRGIHCAVAGRAKTMNASPAFAPPAPRRRILVVDDEAHLADGICENLEAEGYSAETAYDGADGLRKAEGEPFDLIVLDVMMPTMDGLDACRTLRRHGFQTPVLFLSVRGAPADRIRGFEAGGDDYLPQAVPSAGTAAAGRRHPAPHRVVREKHVDLALRRQRGGLSQLPGPGLGRHGPCADPQGGHDPQGGVAGGGRRRHSHPGGHSRQGVGLRDFSLHPHHRQLHRPPAPALRAGRREAGAFPHRARRGLPLCPGRREPPK